MCVSVLVCVGVVHSVYLFASNYPANDVGNNFECTNKMACEHVCLAGARLSLQANESTVCN